MKERDGVAAAHRRTGLWTPLSPGVPGRDEKQREVIPGRFSCHPSCTGQQLSGYSGSANPSRQRQRFGANKSARAAALPELSPLGSLRYQEPATDNKCSGQLSVNA